VARLLTRSAAAPFFTRSSTLFFTQLARHAFLEWGLDHLARVLFSVAALLSILFVTMALAVRAGMHERLWSPTDSESRQRGAQEMGLVDTCARTFVLVLLSLLGLLALGMMYGNVLGSANAGH
jgi:hypothetical protein